MCKIDRLAAHIRVRVRRDLPRPPAPGPQSRCTVSSNVFFHPSSIRSRANVHSEVDRIVSRRRRLEVSSGIYHILDDPCMLLGLASSYLRGRRCKQG